MLTNLRVFSVASLVLAATALPGVQPRDDGAACTSSWDAYYEAKQSWDTVEVPQTVTTEVFEDQLDYNVPYTTLCDGYRRAHTTRYRDVTTTYDPPKTTAIYQFQLSSYPEPEPTCTRTGLGYDPTPRPTASYLPCSAVRGACYMYDSGGVNVYYWPVTTTNGDFCAYNGSTIFAQPTNPPAPNTVVTDGNTFTSPTNYISFATIAPYLITRKYHATACGVSMTNAVAAITGAMTTKGLYDGTQSFNLEDLNTLRIGAFQGQRRCRNNACTVIEGRYTPELALPTGVLELQPEEWKDAGCKGTDLGTSWYHPTMVPLITPVPEVKEKCSEGQKGMV
jgi:hypothetical protein